MGVSDTFAPKAGAIGWSSHRSGMGRKSSHVLIYFKPRVFLRHGPIHLLHVIANAILTNPSSNDVKKRECDALNLGEPRSISENTPASRNTSVSNKRSYRREVRLSSTPC